MKHLKKLVLLHSNDMHGDFLAEQVDDKLVGGVSLLSGYVSKVRQEEPNTLYCIAGDMFRGSIIDQEFQGFSTIELMNMISPDIVTLGNHETDYGVAHLLFLEKCAKFPIVNANLYISTNHAHLFRPYKILEVDGMKILFIGILTEEVMAQTKNDGMVGTFVSVEDAAKEVERICNAHNAVDIDLTVLLTHIGFEEDKKLAGMLDPACGVDVIIGGHSHTFIDEPAKVNNILIVQAGTGTDQIGRFDIMVDTDNNCVDSWKWQAIPINAETCPYDHDLEKLLNVYKGKTDEKYSRVITRFKRRLTHPARTQETELGGVLADALRESLGVDIFLLASGNIRSDWMGPIVMLSDLMAAYPYDGCVHMVKVTGAQLKRMLLYMLRDEVWQGVHSEFYQFSEGLHVVYDRAGHSFREFAFEGAEVSDEHIFTLGLEDYHFGIMEEAFGITPEEVSANMKPRVIASSCLQILEEYLSEHPQLDHQAGGRLTVL
ncbi:MAG: bifunctional metallophosphatase/5'-nucleotidase [Ruminococcaceae bacterium]|nr:bifunctional metallophosphatase/5'-nucleotidase [Oscillospiraceae bacterium]